ncbi:MAG: hypothetical protein HeimC2_33010 [Candidatus Heimdallarchaeota archaeon LC_2]|nr:MAG: hypothetical protein HeimC2_33010 [Candidatus Heimdallarchaeota archaeon LC_2]
MNMETDYINETNAEKRKRWRDTINLDYPVCKPKEDDSVFNGIAQLNTIRLSVNYGSIFKLTYFERLHFWLIDNGYFMAFSVAAQFKDYRDILYGEVQREFIVGIELMDLTEFII